MSVHSLCFESVRLAGCCSIDPVQTIAFGASHGYGFGCEGGREHARRRYPKTKGDPQSIRNRVQIQRGTNEKKPKTEAVKIGDEMPNQSQLREPPKAPPSSSLNFIRLFAGGWEPDGPDPDPLPMPAPIPSPIPRASRTSKATFAAPSVAFFGRARVLLSAPNACALMTASVLEMGGWLPPLTPPEPGEGERLPCSAPFPFPLDWLPTRRLLTLLLGPASPPALGGPRSSDLKEGMPEPSMGLSGPVCARRRFSA